MPAQRLPWFRFWVAATSHAKVRTLDDGTFRTWVELLDAAAQQPKRGRFATRAEAAAITRRPPKHVATLITASLIDETPEGLTMHDWDDWQRWRKEDTNDTGTTTDRPPNGHVIDSRTPTESPTEQHTNVAAPLREKKIRDRDIERDVDVAVAVTPERGVAEFASEFARDCERHTWPADAAELHSAVVEYLEKHGWICQREFPVADRGDGSCGFVDVVASRGEQRMAIEIDAESPRVKSVFKLGQIPDMCRVVLLRGDHRPISVPEGIDTIGFLPNVEWAHIRHHKRREEVGETNGRGPQRLGTLLRRTTAATAAAISNELPDEVNERLRRLPIDLERRTDANAG